MSEQVQTILSVGTALVLAFLIAVGWQAREEIASVVKTIVNRYFVFRWHGVEHAPNILSSERSGDDLNEEAETLVRGGTYQLEPASPVPPAELVRNAVLADDDIIIWLATVKNPDKTAYRFSANKIADLVGGTRNDVLAKVNAAAPDRKAQTPSTASESQMRTVVVRDNGGPPREMTL